VSEGIQNFTNVITALAALGGVSIAGFGLFTWKAQAKWNTDTELARKLLVLMFKHKDEIAQVRSPTFYANDEKAALAGVELPEDADERHFIAIQRIYQHRFDKVSEIRSQIYPLLLEVEAIWGRSARDLFQPIWKLESELGGIIRIYLRSIDPKRPEYERDAAQRSLDKRRDIMYDTLEEEDDDFKKDYSVAMRKIEEFIRPKLGRFK
jgi:hypothetical protein